MLWGLLFRSRRAGVGSNRPTECLTEAVLALGRVVGRLDRHHGRGDAGCRVGMPARGLWRRQRGEFVGARGKTITGVGARYGRVTRSAAGHDVSTRKARARPTVAGTIPIRSMWPTWQTGQRCCE